jgi:hypothetical protein
MDIRLQTAEFEMGGIKYNLVCNMNVLADLQEEYGDISKALDKIATVRTLTFLIASMANEDIYQRNKAGERLPTLTARDVGAMLSPKDIKKTKDIVMPLLIASLKGDEKNA